MNRARSLTIVLATASVLGSMEMAGAGAIPLTSTRVASGLTMPLYVTAPPGDATRIFIVEQRSGTTGRIRVLQIPSNNLLATPFLSVTPVATGNEQGLLGLAFHPDYLQNGYCWIFYNPTAGTTAVARYRVLGDPATSNLADTSSATTVLSMPQTFANHNGGWIGFGPDGYLYIAKGDGGSQNDPNGNGQNANVLMAKMLRIDVDGADNTPGNDDDDGSIGVTLPPYTSPPDNPFVGVAGADEVWSIGLRNSWRNSFDRETGDLYIADVGHTGAEEVNFEPAGIAGTPVRNYGWRCMEGNLCTGLTGCTCNAPELTLPIHTYDHTAGNCSITGGYVYRGCTEPDLHGTYFFADYCTAQIWSFRYSPGTGVTEFTNRTSELAPGGGLAINSITSFGEDAVGELYICDQGGEVFKIVSAAPVPALGTCCLPSAICTQITEADCNAQGGEFQGDCTLCAQAACAPACDPLPADDDDVNHYACNCYSRLGITEADFETAVGGSTIDMSAAHDDRKQLYVTSNGIIRDINTNGAANPRAAASFPDSCDRPAWLGSPMSPDGTRGGKQCYGNSYIRKWEMTATDSSKVTVALLCRHKTVWSDDFTKFDDVAMIVHNGESGETCWFQSPEGFVGTNGHTSVEQDGTSVPAPHTAAATAFWHKPSRTAAINCIKCHDNGPWMNSRWMHKSGIGLRDQLEPYVNTGTGFSDWKKPKFVYFGTEGMVGDIRRNACTRCHGIHSGETEKNAGGNTFANWLEYTIGRTPPPQINTNGPEAFDIAYWMPPNHGAENPNAWKTKYDKHVDLLLDCCKKKGVRDGGAKDACTNGVEPAAGARGLAFPGPIPGVHLYADTDDDGAWDYESTASTNGEPPPITVSSGTPLTVGWSADADHHNCVIGTTFPPGVEVDGTFSGANWLLNESPQTIGVLTVPGEYYFHIDCNDAAYDVPITASLTFQVPGQPPTVLRVDGIVNSAGRMAFDYPAPAQPHVDIPVIDTSDVAIAWAAFNVVPGTCELSETIVPSGGQTPRTFPEESGFITVPLYIMTDQNYELTCLGDDGQMHSVDVTLQVDAAGDCDGDGDLDLADWVCLANCLTGPSVPYPTGCGAFDFDGDGDVDLADAAAFSRAFAG